MELIIVILFFAISSAVCLRIFVHAHQLERKTENNNYAVLWAENAAELFYEYDDSTLIDSTLQSTYAGSVDYSDEYKIQLSFREDSAFKYMDYTFCEASDNSPVYSFTFKKHTKEVAD